MIVRPIKVEFSFFEGITLIYFEFKKTDNRETELYFIGNLIKIFYFFLIFYYTFFNFLILGFQKLGKNSSSIIQTITNNSIFKIKQKYIKLKQKQISAPHKNPRSNYKYFQGEKKKERTSLYTFATELELQLRRHCA